jgi:Tol biopolymer transport system component
MLGVMVAQPAAVSATAQTHEGFSVLGASTATDNGPPMAAQASATAGDIVFEQLKSGPPPHPYQLQERAANGTLTDLSTGSSGNSDYMPDVSPNGARIVFIGDRSCPDQPSADCESIVAMNSDGSGQVILQQGNANPGNPAESYSYYDPVWSPDGSQIAFVEQIYNSSYIAVMNADGTAKKLLTSGGKEVHPSWSPTKVNGRYRLAYEEDNTSSGDAQIFIMNSDGANKHPVATDSGFDDYVPVWSPDGNRIYFVSSQPGLNDSDSLRYYQSTNGFTGGSVARNWLGTVSGLVPDDQPRISADGSELTYSGPDSSGCNQIWIADTSSGTTHKLTNTGCNDQNYAPTFVLATWPNASTKTIVGLGDSVAAGEGINYGFIWTGSKWKPTGPSNPTWMDTTPALGANYQDCHQSGHGYPNLIALNGGNYKVYNMACTGASALQNNGLENGGVLDREIFGDGSSPPAQLGGTCTDCDPPSPVFNAHNPDVVLLTLGADDINFASWVSQCYAPGPSCNTKTNTAALHSQLGLEKIDLTTVLGQLNRWAGEHKALRVLVTNYYNPIDPGNTGYRDYSGPAGLGIVSGERTWIEKGVAALNSNIAADVTTAQSKDLHLSVSLVDLSSLLQNGTPANPGSHAWCTSDPWAYGPSIDYSIKGVFLGFNPAPFHPTPEGQDAIYQAVDTVLNAPA